MAPFKKKQAKNLHVARAQDPSAPKKPDGWDSTMTGQDHLNWLAANFPEVKRFLEQ